MSTNRPIVVGRVWMCLGWNGPGAPLVDLGEITEHVPPRRRRWSAIAIRLSLTNARPCRALFVGWERRR